MGKNFTAKFMLTVETELRCWNMREFCQYKVLSLIGFITMSAGVSAGTGELMEQEIIYNRIIKGLRNMIVICDRPDFSRVRPAISI